jgi:3'-phosphoadenosine 5'-phosphosulfate sulfotransferase (PAPS reductase)/FAD synthetase
MKKLVISFSGGRTSGYMTKKILDAKGGEYDIKVIFANTGFENEATLQFVHDCDTHFGFNTVWIEGVTNMEKGVGMSHKVVTFETASRNGEPFEAVIQKYGIPNMQTPLCTIDLKRYPIEHYLRSIGWSLRDYDLAIGIRTDEQRRVKEPAETERIRAACAVADAALGELPGRRQTAGGSIAGGRAAVGFE